MARSHLALNVLIQLKQQGNISVNFKKLSKKAVVPSYAHDTDAGMDMVAISKTETEDYVEFDIAISYISFEQAKLNMSTEIEGKTFDEVRKEGRIGIPCILGEDGVVTLDWQVFM